MDTIVLDTKRDAAFLEQSVLIVGASHAGVNLAFNLRQQGWTGKITLVDSDPELPYHRPPLSKKLLQTQDARPAVLKAEMAYEQNNIKLILGVTVDHINQANKNASLSDGSKLEYNQLVLATGCSALIPPIKGILSSKHHYTMRNFADVQALQAALSEASKTETPKNVLIIGAGYIGLEAASSFVALGAKVTVIEREKTILSRVSTPPMSDFLSKLHKDNGVNIVTGKDVVELKTDNKQQVLVCKDGSEYSADFILIGVGVKINTQLAEQCELNLDGGIVVNEVCQSSNPDIFAIGDCTRHFNQRYQRWIRLESVQNAVDQAKGLAQFLAKGTVPAASVPWFWSDQYQYKLQIVGLSEGFTESIIRHEEYGQFSIWYFNNDELLCVEAVNHPKSYVLGTQAIKNNWLLNKSVITDTSMPLAKDSIVVA